MRNIKGAAEAGLVIIALVGLIIIAAASSKEQKKKTREMITEPIIHAYKDVEMDYSKFETFSLFFYSKTEEGKKTVNNLLEKELLFDVKKELENKGYKYKESFENPDETNFIVSIYFSNTYNEVYIPPTTIVLPQYIPGSTTRYSGFVGGEYVWGSARTSGSWTAQPYTKSGYYEGYFYPYIAIDFHDDITYNRIWSGNAIVSTKESDGRIEAKKLIKKIIEKFPNVEIPQKPLQEY